MRESSIGIRLVTTCGRLWEVLTRKRAVVPTPKRCQRLNDRTFHEQNHRKAIYFIYQGLGITVPLGVCYVLGMLVQIVPLNDLILSLVLAAITMFLSGMSLCDLITTSDQCSGHVSTAIYQLVGEFPAYCSAVLCCLTSCASLAALTKTLSSTMNELLHESVVKFLRPIFSTPPSKSESLGTFYLTSHPPDVLAFGATIVTSVILACGLKQAGILRTIMNAFGFAVYLLTLLIGAIEFQKEDKTEKHFTKNQVLLGSGIACCLFMQFLELGRRSKQSQNVHQSMRVSILASCTTVFFLSLALSVTLAFHFYPKFSLSGALVIKLLQLKGLEWACLLLGSLQVVTCALGVSESGEIFGRYLVSEASNGFVPHYLSKENSKSFSHTRAHLFGGFTASLLALSLSHTAILEFLAANLLLMNIVIVVVVLYRPFRCLGDSIFSTFLPSNILHSKSTGRASSFSSRSHRYVHSPAKTALRGLGHRINLNYLKEGIKSLKSSKTKTSRNNEDDEIPLLSPLINENSYESQNYEELNEKTASQEFLQQDSVELRLKDNETQIEHSSDNILVEQSTLYSQSDCENEGIELITLNSSPNNHQTSKEPDEFLEDEDIDAVIAEYKQKLRITSQRPKSIATKTSARIALFCIISLIGLAITFADYLHRYTKVNTDAKYFLYFIVGTGLILSLNFIILYKLPSVIRRSQSEIKMQLFIFISRSIGALMLNFILLYEIMVNVKWIVLPLHISALLWYTLYGYKNSAAVSSEINRTRGIESESNQSTRDREIVSLSSPEFSASLYTVRTQSEHTEQRLNL